MHNQHEAFKLFPLLTHSQLQLPVNNNNTAPQATTTTTTASPARAATGATSTTSTSTLSLRKLLSESKSDNTSNITALAAIGDVLLVAVSNGNLIALNTKFNPLGMQHLLLY